MRCRWLIAVALLAVPRFAVAADVAIEVGTETLEFKVGKEVVARYRISGTVQVEKGEGTKPLAKPFLWPVLAPNGVPVTRAWPMDRTKPDASLVTKTLRPEGSLIEINLPFPS